MSDEADSRIELIRSQWHALSGWLRVLDSQGALPLAQPSTLEGWTVAELITHLGRGMLTAMLTHPAEPGVQPISLSDYVRAYTGAAEETAEVTRQLEREVGDTRLDANDSAAAEAFERLRMLGGYPIAAAPRGPLRVEDFFMTRLFELVVHGGDLARSIPDAGPAPLDPEAVEQVADAFARMAEERLGAGDIIVVSPQDWVALASGRAPLDERTAASVQVSGHDGPALETLAGVVPLF